MLDLEGKTIVLTGAGGGVGTALIELFLQCGARIIACDIAGTKLNFDLKLHEFDLSNKIATHNAAASILSHGTPDIVISNAGWTRAETMQQLSPEAFDHELDLNLRGAVHFTGAFLAPMRASKNGGNFVFVSSINAQQHFGNPAYSAAKAGINAWMRSIATEEGTNNIRANAVLPGSIRTNAWDHRLERDPEIISKVNSLYPLGRMVEPKEVAMAVAFLASSMSSGITGVSLPVDAGLTASNLPFIKEIS